MAKIDYNTVIVGAGFGRICCAAILAKRGLKVLVIEEGNTPGGHSATAQIGSYGFDLEASLIWGLDEGGVLHWLLGQLGAFESLGKKEKALLKLDPAYQIILPSGRLNVFQNREALFDEFEREFPRDIDALALIYDLADEADLLLYGSGWGHPFSPWAAKSWIKAKVGELGLVTKLRELEAEKRSLLTDRRLSSAARYYLDAHAFFFGGYESFLDCPISLAGAILSIAGRGVCSFEGGSDAIVRLIEESIIRNGGEISYGIEPRRIILQKDKTLGIAAAIDDFETEIFCDNFVTDCPALGANMDFFPPGRPRDTAQSLYADVKDSWQSRSAFIGFSEEIVPELMAQNVLVYGGGYEEVPAADAMSLCVSPAWDERRAPRGKRAVTTTIYKKNRSPSSAVEAANWDLDNLIACVEVAIPFASKFLDNACLKDDGSVSVAAPGLPAAGSGAGSKENPYLYCLTPKFCNPINNIYFIQDSAFLGRTAAFAATSGLYAAELILKKY